MFRKRRPSAPSPQQHPFPGRRRPRRPRHSLWLYVFAFIGVAAVCFLLFKYLIIPLLVQLA
ncbi:MAG: hypothetical protein IKE24_13000 [Clostridia bacterium]|nr:hypothetical protein [Clostridia bacterium]